MHVDLDPNDFFYTEKYHAYKQDVIRSIRKLGRHALWTAFSYVSAGSAVYALVHTEYKVFAYFMATALVVMLYHFKKSCETIADILHYRSVFMAEFRLFLKKKFKKTAAR